MILRHSVMVRDYNYVELSAGTFEKIRMIWSPSDGRYVGVWRKERKGACVNELLCLGSLNRCVNVCRNGVRKPALTTPAPWSLPSPVHLPLARILRHLTKSGERRTDESAKNVHGVLWWGFSDTFFRYVLCQMDEGVSSKHMLYLRVASVVISVALALDYGVGKT